MKTISAQDFVNTYGQDAYLQFEPLAATQRSPAASLAIGAAKGLGSITKDTGDLIQAGANGIPLVGKAIGKTIDATQNAVGLTDENLTASNGAEMVGKAGAIAGSVLSPFVASSFARLASRSAGAVAETAPQAAGMIGRGIQKAKEFVSNPKLALSKQNVSPQLETSATRFLDGTKRLDDPLELYEKDFAQSQKALTDIKVDPAISTVGEEIGDAFKAVVDQRRTIGKTMSEELKKISGIQTNTLKTIDTFVSDLANEGLQYDRVAKTLKATAKQTKMGADDQKLLETYASELQKLGSKPTVGELDAFMSRIPSEISVYKSSKNILGTTNAERIIKKSLSDLREQFNPSNNPAFEKYYNARKEYADLSDFMEEGSSYLGKLTQSGDFAKDASLAKSSVQSILNNGKKDWLEKLEQKTGYPALDRSVIALQAMKDAGDFRGLSLLDELSKGTPQSAGGLQQRLIDYGMKKAGEMVGGTPDQQTRTFLKALKETQPSNPAFGAAMGVDPTDSGEIDPEQAVIGAMLGIFGRNMKKAQYEEAIEALKKSKIGKSLREGRWADKAIQNLKKQYPEYNK